MSNLEFMPVGRMVPHPPPLVDCITEHPRTKSKPRGLRTALWDKATYLFRMIGANHFAVSLAITL